MAGAPDDVGLLAMAAGARGAGGRVRPAMPRPSPRAEILRAASGEFRTGPPRGAAADREPVDDLFALALGGLTAG
ncbi:hypothetical protein [Pseudonocardia acidicola]|uniref:TetR family transcriptional regulator n=1 Tax=Pseudonocardia acidicola TaxID=2724939 RepID=A0ABX1SEB4_9PSEU|nr:hypothetical protein [Pseudonocardia acidicola]NMH99254.1 hypothetical protein [Pseudonocardia acidicola]